MVAQQAAPIAAIWRNIHLYSEAVLKASAFVESRRYTEINIYKLQIYNYRRQLKKS